MAELERITQPTLDVLDALLGADEFELHGWAIMKHTGRGGPTVYKILERLTAANWVEAKWDAEPVDPNKPRKRFYRLTPLGASSARQVIARRRPNPSFRPAFGCGDAWP